jgi:hypothetical protein
MSERPVEDKKSRSFDLRFSDHLPPFPEHLDQVRPGMRLSEARAAFPQGTLAADFYTVDLESGPFSRVAFYSLSSGEDPIVGSVNFFFENEEARQRVVAETLRKFGGTAHSSESLGARLRWPKLNGFVLVVDDNSYRISSRDEH